MDQPDEAKRLLDEVLDNDPTEEERALAIKILEKIGS
jgi:hypothetical protein